jgi:DNA repair exonuclease SbcCD ATPase subunit
MIRANAERKKNNVSLIEYIRNLIQSKAVARANADTTEDLAISMAKARAAALLLNVALSLVASAGIAFVISKINEARTKLETAANTARENVDAANQVTSSLKELVSTYEELGDKSEWNTDDLEQAKDVQDQILDLLKDQDEAIQNKLGNLDLENGKYKEQLQILKDITLEQLKAANDSLKQQKDAQGALFQSEAEKQIGTGQYIVSDAENTAFAKELVDKFGGSFDENTGVLNLGLDTSTAEGAAAAYEKLGKILSYVTENYDDAERAQLGLYQTMLGDKSALQSQADAYNEVSKALEDNTVKIGQYTLSQDIATAKEKESASQEKSTQPTAEIDAKIKATKEYQDAVKEAQKTEEEWNSQGYGKYGNIDNFHRDKIDWTDDTLKQYKDFVAEQNDMEPGTVGKGGYSTVLGSWQFLSEYFDDADSEKIFAFTPMLQTDDGLVPLTQDQLRTYFSTIIEKATNNDGTVDIDKLMKLDATGLDEDINGIITHVKGMIAGVNGGKDKSGGTYSAADILAISGDSNEDIKKDLKKIYGSDADLTPIDEDGNLSRYIGKSMHDAQATAQQGKDNIEAVYNQLYDDLGNKSGENSNRLSSQLEDAFGDIAKSLGKDSEKLSISDVLGLTTDGIELTDEQATALDVLTQAADKYHTTIEGVAQASEENGLFGGAENAANNVLAAAKDMETLSQQIDNIQKAYKSCSTAVDEYNKYGYMSADALQSLLSMDYEYLNCMELVNGKLVLNNDAFAQMVASKYADAKVTAVQNAIAQIQAITQDSVKESTDGATEAMDDEVNKLNELSPGLGDAIKGTVGLATAQDLLNAVTEKQPVNPDRVQTILNGLNTQLSVIDSTIDTILSGSSKIKTHLNGFNKNNKSKSKSASKSVTDVASAFDTLTKAMKEYNQYGYISADTMKSMMKLEDKFTSCLVKNGDKLEINANEFRKLVETQLKQEEASGKASKSADELKRILSYLDSNVHSSTISFEQLTDVIKGYGTAMDEAKEKTDAIKSAFSGLYNIQQKIKNSQFGVGDLDATESKIESILQLSKFFGDNKDLMDNLVDKNGNINLNTEAFKKATLDELDKRIKAANETGGAAATALANSLSSDKANIESGKISVSDYLVGLGTDLERVNTELDKYQTNWSTLKDAMDEWNTTGQLTQDTMQKLQELPEEFSNLLTYDEDGNAKIDVKALRQSYVDKLSAFAKEFEGSPIGIQVQAMIDDVREPTHEEYVKLAKKTATYQKVLAQYTKKMSAIDSNKNLSEDEALKQKAEVQKELDDALEKALLEVQETDEQVTTKLKKHWDGVEKVIEEFKSALSDAKAVLSSFLSLLSTLNDKSNNDLKIWGDVMNKVIDKRIKALNKQKEALEENNEATERAIELSKAQDALARAQQQRTTRVYTENGYEWQANAEDVRTAREDLADKQREWNKKDAEKAIDDQIKKYNEFKDKLSEVMDDIGKSWKDYQKELEYTAQIQKMTLSQMEGSLDGYHNKIIASLNTGSAITSIQNLITNLESLINTLTKVNNLYSWAKTGEYKDLGTKGLWNTIKGFFNKGGEEATGESANVVENFFNVLRSKVQTSGNGLVETFSGIWKKIKAGAQSLFSGSGEGGGIVSTVVNGFKAIGNAVSKSKIGSTLIKGAGKLVTGAGGLIKGAVSAIGTAGASAIPVVGGLAAAAGLGIYGGTKAMKNQKKIWSNKEDGFGKKAIKSVASFFWDISPIGGIVNLCKDIFGKSKETAENTKDTANSSSETAENTQKSATNLTINATQIVSKEENKATDETDKKNDATANEDKTVKTAATTLTGAGLGAAAGMAIGGPVGALIGTLLGGFAGFFLGGHANGLKSSKTNHFANVDERGSELIVRKPASGRYTYLETGDGVVPADITSRLFEMGGNPDKWFSDQLAKHSSASMVQSRDAGGISLSIGDVNVNNPVGDSDALARELVNRLPNKVVQELNRR